MSVFVDTNILIYAAQLDADAAKARRALEVLDRDDCVLSTQCLNEFVFQSTRAKRVRRLDLDQALPFAETLQRFPVVSVDLNVFAAGARVARLTGYRWWDSLIVAAAITAGCETLATEDMQHGRLIEGVRIENPFRELA